MDLTSLRSGKSYFNPFTALIGLETAAGDRRLSLSIPVIEDGRTARYSILFHELTHLWSMRSTLLGAVLSAAAAKAWTSWNKRADSTIELSDRVIELLGTWLPILEGLATYTELDFEGDEDRDPIHSPVLKLIHYTALASKGIPNNRQFKLVRFSRVFEDHLLSNLMFDTANHPSEHAYLVGYLYVKSLAVRLASVCPRLEAPARMLPLLIKLLCDHSMFVDWRRGKVTVSELLIAVQRSALSLDGELLNLIADWVEKGDPADVVRRFDSLDLEISAEKGSLVFREPTNAWYDDLNESEIVTLRHLRGSGSFYLVAWASGILTHVDENSIKLRGSSEESEYVMLSSADFAKFNPDRANLELALGMRDHVVRSLQDSVGHLVTAALYIDVASGDPGMVFWKDESLLIASPYSVSPLTKGTKDVQQFAENLGASLALSPNLRRDFGRAIKASNTYLSAASEASRWHLGQLTSSAQLHEAIMRDKLKAIDNGRHVAEFDAWCAPQNPLHFDSVPAAALAAYDRIFDFPGFGPENRLRFANLLPSYEITL
jgi:hypothetical protein